MIEKNILILAIVNMTEGMRNLIGDRGAKAVIRDAGKQAGPKLLESLIGHFPENLQKEEATRRACIVLEELGFAKSIQFDGSKVIAEEDVFTSFISGDNLIDAPLVYFFAGLIEGLASFMSDQRVILQPEEVQVGRIVYRVI